MNKFLLGLISIAILSAEAAEIALTGEIYLVAIPLWIASVFFLILTVINRKKTYRYALQMADALHELGGHDELEQKLRTGFANFEDRLPPRGAYTPERKEYEECFKTFAKLDLSTAPEETKALQKAVLKQHKIFSVLMTLFITWILQPALVIVMKIVMGK